MRYKTSLFIAAAIFLWACKGHPGTSREGRVDTLAANDSMFAKADSQLLETHSLTVDTFKADNTLNHDTVSLIPSKDIDTKQVPPNSLVNFAETLIGTPYVYASSNPKVGFDCSGFITYVFNHFGISVPRSSIDFTGVGKEIPVARAKRGDIILFTGTDSTERFVGHMGIVVSNSDTLRFIHSTSGKAMGVTITPLNKYYLGRFVKTIRVFPQNDT
ncbi:MAG TPA: C40 family peptidase [Flavisolibacter sp.]|nr:C40 family peptidase [Flavisolibacter sp.]